MLIFLYGEDSYRSRLKLNEILEKYKKTNKGEVQDFDFTEKEIDFNQFKNEFFSLSIFQESKLVILRGVFGAKDFKENFLKNSKDFIGLKNVIVFYETSKVLQSGILFKFLIKEAKCQEFKLLTPQQTKLWAKKEIEKYGAKITPVALERLVGVKHANNNLWSLRGEILKLVNFTKEIKENDVEQLAEAEAKADIFKTIDFVVQRNRKQALLAIRNHLKIGESPLYLFSMINFQFRNLLLAKSCGGFTEYEAIKILASKLKMHPYVAKKSLIQAGSFSEQELKKIYYKLFQLDLDMKTGKIKPEVALEMFVALV